MKTPFLTNKSAFFIISIVLFFLSPGLAVGAGKSGKWTNITKEIASKGKVQYFYQDKQKNLWFWTDSGLNIYDSNIYNGNFFRNIPLDHLSGKQLKKIFEDSNGYLWFLTDGGITWIRTQNRKNALIFEKPIIIANSKKLNLNSVYEDREGNIWFWKTFKPEFQGIQTTRRSVSVKTIKSSIVSLYKFNKGLLEQKEIKFVDSQTKPDNPTSAIRMIGIFENKIGQKIFKTTAGYCLYEKDNTCNAKAIKGKLLDENNQDVSKLLYWDEFNHHLSSYSYYKDSNENLWFLVYKNDGRDFGRFFSPFSPYSASSKIFSLIRYDGERFKHYSIHEDGSPVLLAFPSFLNPYEEFWPQFEDDTGTIIFPTIGGIFLVDKFGYTKKIPWESGFTTPFLNAVVPTNTDKYLIRSQNGITLYSYDDYKEKKTFKTLIKKKMLENKMISEHTNKWKIFFDRSGKMLIFEWSHSDHEFGERPKVKTETLLRYDGNFLEIFDGIKNGILNIVAGNIEAPIVLDNLYIGHGPLISAWLPAGKYNVILDNRVQGYDLPCKAVVHEGRKKKLQKCIGRSNLNKRFIVNVIPGKQTTLISKYNQKKSKDFNTVLKINAFDKSLKDSDINDVSKFFFDRKGYLWFNANRGAIKFIGTEMKPFYGKTILFESRTGDLFFDDRADNSIKKYDGKSFKKIAFKQNDVAFLFEDSDGGIWFESQGSLGIIQKKTIRYFDENDGLLLPKKSFYDVVVSEKKIQSNIKSIRLSNNLKKRSIITSFYNNINTHEIWFGSVGAVMKYDGKKFITYKLPEQSHLKNTEKIVIKYSSVGSLSKPRPGNLVLHIAQDNSGEKLWFATFDRLFEMETKTGIIKELNRENVFQDKYITTLLYDTYGQVLWIGLNKGIVRFDHRNGIFKAENFIGIENIVSTDKIDFRKIIGSNIFSYNQEGKKLEENQKLWMIINGLIKPKNAVNDPPIADIFQDSRGDIWFLPFETVALFRYNRGEKSFESFYRERGDIKIFHEDKWKQVWIANNYNNDIEVFNGETYSVYPNIQDFQPNPVKFIREDRSGNLWVETEKGIALYIQPQFEEFWVPGIFKKIDYRALNPFSQNSVSESNKILDFKSIERKSGKYNQVIWTPFGQYILSMGNRKNFISFKGLSNRKLLDGNISPANASNFIYRLKSKGYLSFTTTHFGIKNILFFGSFSKGEKPKIVPAPFTSINSFYENDLSVFFTAQNGAFRYDIGDNKIVNVLKPEYTEEIKNVNVILQDNLKNIWIGTDKNGLFLVKDGEIIKKFSEEYGMPMRKILSFHEDRSGNIWVGTDNGLVSFTINPEKSKEIKFRPFLPNELLGRRINTIFEDRAGFLWLGLSDGVIKYSHKFGVNTKIISMEAGEETTAIKQDPEGNIWFGFSSGRIIRYQPLKTAITDEAIKINGKDFKKPFILKRPLDNITVKANVPDYSIKSIKISSKGEFSKTKILNPQLFYSLNLVKTDVEKPQVIKSVSSLGKPLHFDNLSENGNYTLKINYNNEKLITASFKIAIPFYIKHVEKIAYITFFLLIIVGSYLVIIANQAKTEKLTSFALAHTVISSINRTNEFISDLMTKHRNWNSTSIKTFLDNRIDSAYFFANEGRHLVSFILNMPLSSKKYIPFFAQKTYNCWEIQKYITEVNLQSLLKEYTSHFLDISNSSKLKKKDKSKLINISQEIKNKKFNCNENALRATIFELLKNAWRYNDFEMGVPTITLEKVDNERLKITITNNLLENVNNKTLEISSKKLTTFKGGKNSFGRYLVGKFLKQSSKWGERIENNKYSVWFEFMAIEGKKI